MFWLSRRLNIDFKYFNIIILSGEHSLVKKAYNIFADCLLIKRNPETFSVVQAKKSINQNSLYDNIEVLI